MSGLLEAWTIESFPFKRQPGVSPKEIRTLAELEFVAKAENIVSLGQTGVGKTGLASGLLLKAIQNGYRGRFIRAQDLFDDMYASLADRSTRLLNTLIRIDCLLIDELGYVNLRPGTNQHLLQADGGTLPPQTDDYYIELRLSRMANVSRQQSPRRCAPQSASPSMPHDSHRRALAA
jgi:IstB-like ATP binding protein